jgi:hypothetical protein
MANPGNNDLFSFRQDFANLHGFLSRVAEIPIPLESSAFTARYGEVQDARGVRQIQEALRDLREMASTAGDPKSLKRTLATDIRALTHSSPPQEIYAQIAWLAERAGNAAGSMTSTFASLKDLTEAGVSEAQRAASVRNIFKGDRGLIATAGGVAEDAERLAAEVDPLIPRVIQPVQLFNVTPVLREAAEAIRKLQSQLNVLRSGADEKESKGMFAKLLGRGKAKEESSDGPPEIAQVSEELERKNLLSADLQKFLPGSERALPALQNIARKLRDIAKIFSQASARFSSVVSLASDAQLSDYDWLSKAIDLPASLATWQNVRDASRRFVQESLIDLE